MQAGTYLKASSKLDEDFFANAVVLITASDEKGAVGFVVNRPFGRNLNDIEEFRNSVPFPLFDGGPVDHEHLFFIHRRPDLIPGAKKIYGNIFLGGDFRAAIKCLNNKSLTDKDIKLFVGYCGWDASELETELQEGDWLKFKFDDLVI